MDILSRLTPPPFQQPTEPYEGLEWKYKIFVFRPALLKNELVILSVILVYVVVAFYGKWQNSRRANKWFQVHLPLLESQFSRPTAGSLTADGSSDFFNFSTGRRNVASLHTIFALRPRHDLFQWLFQTFRTFIDLQYRPKDDLQLDFKLLPGTLPDSFVWGRWDLTFTKITENPSLPASLSAMSEFADVTESIFKVDPGLLKVFKDPKNLTYFRSLSVTDQPRERPSSPLLPNEREKHVILTLHAPSTSHAADTLTIVSAIFPLIDALSKLTLRPETKNKLKKTREDLDKDLKEEAEREKKEELSQAKEDQRAAKKKKEEERIARLSAAEQKRVFFFTHRRQPLLTQFPAP
ncbi:hypothetical protein C8J56DRAFT_934437 [Mycena floridula]|nr:hypothetical protein C8J56DRAFT_934437 [Mycena floridula]